MVGLVPTIHVFTGCSLRFRDAAGGNLP